MSFRLLLSAIFAASLVGSLSAADNSHEDHSHAGHNPTGVSKKNVDCSHSADDMRKMTEDIRAMTNGERGSLRKIQARFARIKEYAVACASNQKPQDMRNASGADQRVSEVENVSHDNMNNQCKQQMKDIAERVDKVNKVLGEARRSDKSAQKNDAIQQAKQAAGDIQKMLDACKTQDATSAPR